MTVTHEDERLNMIQVTEQTLDVAEHMAAVDDPRCGAVTTFVGQVRDHDPGVTGTVTSISYSAHPDAQSVLERIVAEVSGGADPLRIAVSHRVGALVVGDLALVVSVASAHRAQSYAASREVVERIKVELPVWKKQHTADGAGHWSGI
ncbi:molybdenum cofactor biosynthesis protein MoaE [Pseudactinotalea sp. Z1739]|uniref:molybdenum cofactor biosynthesis protein MoaE n=1 Tax=Pseudactinotalea sp. Z1739 TaxID=3413028 RepID=UPI003C7AC088